MKLNKQSTYIDTKTNEVYYYLVTGFRFILFSTGWSNEVGKPIEYVEKHFKQFDTAQEAEIYINSINLTPKFQKKQKGK